MLINVDICKRQTRFRLCPFNYRPDNFYTEVQQAHLIKIWLLAAGTGGKIPHDATWIGRKIGAKSKVNLEPMIELGFLIPVQLEKSEKDKRWISLEKGAESTVAANDAANVAATVVRRE